MKVSEFSRLSAGAAGALFAGASRAASAWAGAGPARSSPATTPTRGEMAFFHAPGHALADEGDYDGGAAGGGPRTSAGRRP